MVQNYGENERERQGKIGWEKRGRKFVSKAESQSIREIIIEKYTELISEEDR